MGSKTLSMGLRVTGVLKQKIEDIAEREAGRGHFAMRPNMSELLRHLLELGVDAYERQASTCGEAQRASPPTSSRHAASHTTRPQGSELIPSESVSNSNKTH